MTFHVSTRWGDDVENATEQQIREVLAELDAIDDEHPSVSLKHHSDWCLGAYPGGLLVWENVEEAEPRHMEDVTRERVLQLWLQLSEGNFDAIEREPWLPGYGSDDPADRQAATEAAARQTLEGARAFYDSLGSERANHPCRQQGCSRGSVPFSIYCRPHHYESLRHVPCPFDH